MDRLTGPGWIGLHLVVAVCVLLFVPLGLGALGRGRRLTRWWPMVAVPAVLALLLPRGLPTGLLGVPYLLACLAVPVVLRRDWLAAFAAACLPVAAAGLVAERAGYELLGYPMGVLGLTAAHFHAAGFGALLLLSFLQPRPSRHLAPAQVAAPAQVRAPAPFRGPAWLLRAARLLAPAGVGVVGLGFLTGRTPLGEEAGDLIELLGAGLLSAGLWLALATRAGRAARLLFALSLVTMSLAVLYAAGQVLDLPHLGLTWMVLTHGVLNAAAVLTALAVAWAGREQPWSAHHWSHRIGTGPERFETASAALLGWHMHRAAGAWVTPDTPPASADQHMLSRVGVGRLRVPEPCEVTDVVREPNRTVLHYRALPGHTFEGDESFTVRLGADGVVRFEVAVRSRPAILPALLAGPVVPAVQWLFIARCAAALRRARPATVSG